MAARLADLALEPHFLVWIPLLNGFDHPKAARARAVIEGPEDVGVPGIILEEILRGLRSDALRSNCSRRD